MWCKLQVKSNPVKNVNGWGQALDVVGSLAIERCNRWVQVEVEGLANRLCIPKLTQTLSNCWQHRRINLHKPFKFNEPVCQ